jgi:hypothetical protein
MSAPQTPVPASGAASAFGWALLGVMLSMRPEVFVGAAGMVSIRPFVSHVYSFDVTV